MRTLIFQAIRELLLNVPSTPALIGPASPWPGRNLTRSRSVVADEGIGFSGGKSRQAAARPSAGASACSASASASNSWGARPTSTANPAEAHASPSQCPAPRRKPLSPPKRRPARWPPPAMPLRKPPSRRSQDKNIIRVLLADDHEVVRTGLARLLQTEPDIQVVGQAADGDEAVENALRIRPRVVLMDVSMPRMSGVEAHAPHHAAPAGHLHHRPVNARAGRRRRLDESRRRRHLSRKNIAAAGPDCSDSGMYYKRSPPTTDIETDRSRRQPDRPGNTTPAHGVPNLAVAPCSGSLPFWCVSPRPFCRSVDIQPPACDGNQP